MIKIMGEKTFGGLGGVIPVQTAPNVYVWLICIKDGAHAGTTEAARELRRGIKELSGAAVTVVLSEEFVSILVRALGLYDASAECSFEDVAPEHWSYRYVASAVKAKAVYGIDKNNFGMSRPISRRDMCVMLLRGLNAVGCTVAEGEAVEFADAESIGSYAQKAVLKLASAGVVAGMGDGMFMPEAAATRAQTVRLIHTALAVKTAGSDNLEPAPTEEPVRDGQQVNVNVDVDYNGGGQTRTPYAGADAAALAAYTDKIMHDPSGKDPVAVLASYAIPIWGSLPSIMLNDAYDKISRSYEEQSDAAKTWIDADMSHLLPTLSFTAEESEIISTCLADVTTCCNEYSAKYIMGLESFDSWNTYVDKVKSMGVDKVVAAYQAAYDRYLSY